MLCGRNLEVAHTSYFFIASGDARRLRIESGTKCHYARCHCNHRYSTGHQSVLLFTSHRCFLKAAKLTLRHRRPHRGLYGWPDLIRQANIPHAVAKPSSCFGDSNIRRVPTVTTSVSRRGIWRYQEFSERRRHIILPQESGSRSAELRSLERPQVSKHVSACLGRDYSSFSSVARSIIQPIPREASQRKRARVASQPCQAASTRNATNLS